MIENEETKTANAYYGDDYKYGDHRTGHNFLYKVISMEAEEIYETSKALMTDGSMAPRVRRALMTGLEHEKRELARYICLLQSLDPALGAPGRMRPGGGYYDRYEESNT
jgi:hypothetical protein